MSPSNQLRNRGSLNQAEARFGPAREFSTIQSPCRNRSCYARGVQCLMSFDPHWKDLDLLDLGYSILDRYDTR
jgi:hypothetical protein